ncbi:MAG: protein kinase [Isosphaeraceae bacterium]
MAESTQWQTLAPKPRSWEGPDGADPAREFWRLWRQGQQPRVEDFLARAGISDPEQIVSVLRVDQAERSRLGQWVPAETYLDAFPIVRESAECAIDLVFAEYLLREEQGERPAFEEFQGRFPQYAGVLKLQIDLHQAMEADREPTEIWAGSSATLHAQGSAEPRDGSATYPEIPGYEILGVLGRGGMAVVYRAWQTELKRSVAVKMVHAGAQASPQVLARLRVEAEAVAQLRHPNIVPIHEVGQHAGSPFLVLELVEGRSLAQWLAGTPQPARAAAELLETLARAIHTAHSQGVIHRDLTPANILVDADGVPKITDFGLAKLVIGGGEMRTQTGDLLGTPSYMAPEQADNRRQAIGAATDVYALGAILYELLTGRPPFKAELPMETLRQVLTDEPVSPSRLRPKLPRDLETICLKCLRKEAAQRYASALALAEDLRRFREGRPITARRSTWAERFWRWCRRNPGLAGASIAAATLTTILAIVSTIAAGIFYHQRDQISRDNLRIQSADRKTRENLFESLVSQAQARRFSRHVGQRFESLAALEQAARIARELELPTERFEPLRDEAIACLALPDMRKSGRVIDRPPRVLLVAFDPSMTRYALRFRDGTILVKNVHDDQQVARFHARGDRGIFVFGFSPDGRYLATTHSPELALTVWDLDRRAVALDDAGPVSSARFSPDSRRIALCRVDGPLLFCDLSTGRHSRRWSLPTVGDLAFRSDGAQIAVTTKDPKNASCRILEVDTGQVVRTFPLSVSRYVRVIWSPDGTTLATAYDEKMYLYDAATGTRKATLEGSTNHVINMGFHPAGTLLASNGWEHRLRLWDAVLGRTVLSLPGNYSPASSEFSRDGRIVVSREEQLTTYQVDPALEYRSFVHASDAQLSVEGLSIRRDGRLLAVGTDRGVVLCDLASGREIAFLPIGNARYLMFEASGDLLTSGSVGMRRWPVRLDSDRGEFRIGPPTQLPLPQGAGEIAEDRSGRVVALANFEDVRVLTPERPFGVGPLDECRYVAVSPDGQWLATGSHAFGAQVWRVRDSARVAGLPIDDRTRVAFSPDGKWLMTTSPPCELWAVGNWREAARKIGGNGLCFLPDGRLLAVMDATKVIRLVEAETGRMVARLESPDLCDVTRATFSPDGSRLVVTTLEGPAVHAWDLRAIRRRLAAMGLDWDAPAYADADPADAKAPPLPPLQVDLGPLAGEIEHFTESPVTLIERYTARLKNDPNDIEAYHHRAHALVDRSRFQEGVDDFTRALRERPDDAHLRASRGRALQSLKQYESAVHDLEAALARDPQQPFARESLALCCNNRAWELAASPESILDPQRALVLARRAIELSPGQAMYLNTLGVAQYRSGQYAEAITTLERSLAAGAGQSDAYNLFFLAMAHHRLGHADQARACFDRAVRWLRAQKSLLEQDTKELTEFRTEATAVLAGPAGEPPADVFARPG